MKLESNWSQTGQRIPAKVEETDRKVNADSDKSIEAGGTNDDSGVDRKCECKDFQNKTSDLSSPTMFTFSICHIRPSCPIFLREEDSAPDLQWANTVLSVGSLGRTPQIRSVVQQGRKVKPTTQQMSSETLTLPTFRPSASEQVSMRGGLQSGRNRTSVSLQECSRGTSDVRPRLLQPPQHLSALVHSFTHPGTFQRCFQASRNSKFCFVFTGSSPAAVMRIECSSCDINEPPQLHEGATRRQSEAWMPGAILSNTTKHQRGMST